MGIDYGIYLGTYIEVKTKGLTHMVKSTFDACVNANCKFHKASATGKFCEYCGGIIQKITEEYEEEYDPFEMCEDHDILDQISPDADNCENGDTQIFLAHLEDSKGGSWDPKREEVWEDLSDLNAQEEIAKVKVECAKALDILREKYGVEPVIKFGVLGWSG